MLLLVERPSKTKLKLSQAPKGSLRTSPQRDVRLQDAVRNVYHKPSNFRLKNGRVQPRVQYGQMVTSYFFKISSPLFLYSFSPRNALPIHYKCWPTYRPKRNYQISKSLWKSLLISQNATTKQRNSVDKISISLVWRNIYTLQYTWVRMKKLPSLGATFMLLGGIEYIRRT